MYALPAVDHTTCSIALNEEKRRVSQPPTSVQQVVVEAWHLIEQLTNIIRRPSLRAVYGDSVSHRRDLYRLFVAVKYHENTPALWDGFAACLQRSADDLKRDWKATSDITTQQARRMLALQLSKGSLLGNLSGDLIFKTTTFLDSADVDNMVTLYPHLTIWERYCHFYQPCDWNVPLRAIDPFTAAISVMPEPKKTEAWRRLGLRLAEKEGAPYFSTMLCMVDDNDTTMSKKDLCADGVILSNGYLVQSVSPLPNELEKGYQLQVRSADGKQVIDCGRYNQPIKNLMSLADSKFSFIHHGILEIWGASPDFSAWTLQSSIGPIEPPNTSRYHWASVSAVCMSAQLLPDKRLVVADSCSRLHLWDYESGAITYGPMPLAFPGSFSTISMFPLADGKIAAVYADAIRIWGNNCQLLARLVHPLDLYNSPVESISLTDHKHILVTYQNEKVLWQPDTAKLMQIGLMTFLDELS